jgi:hypothetical protein
MSLRGDASQPARNPGQWPSAEVAISPRSLRAVDSRGCMRAGAVACARLWRAGTGSPGLRRTFIVRGSACCAVAGESDASKLLQLLARCFLPAKRLGALALGAARRAAVCAPACDGDLFRTVLRQFADANGLCATGGGGRTQPANSPMRHPSRATTAEEITRKVALAAAPVASPSWTPRWRLALGIH